MSSRIGSCEPGEPDHRARRNRSEFDEDDAPGYKRQRTALACDSCRSRKSRCNGVRPMCATCRALGFECVYRGPVPTPRLQTRDMQTMEKRLQRVEDLLLAIVEGQHDRQNFASVVPSTAHPDIANGRTPIPESSMLNISNSNGFQQDQSRTRRENENPTTNVRFSTHPDPRHSDGRFTVQNRSTLSCFSSNVFHQGRARAQGDEPISNLLPLTQDDTVDGMGSIIFAGESSSGFFGPSSNSSFFSNIARALVAGTGTMPEGKDFSRDLAGNMSRPPSPPLQSRADPSPVNPYKLPPRPEILRLIEIFFSFTGRFFPYISRNNLTQMVEELDMVRFSGIRKSWLCLLNAVLAMGTSLDRDSERQVKFREEESDVFFQRALILSPWTISNTANLETCERPESQYSLSPKANTSDSASTYSNDTVSTRNFQICTDLETPWTTCSGCVPNRGPY